MRFTELTLDEFKQHTSENKSHFTQMVENYHLKVETGKQAFLVGVKDDGGQVIASCLVTLSPLMRVMRHAYTNRGPVLDYSNKELFTFFFTELEKFLKPRKVVSLRVDPYEVLNVRNHDGEILEDKNLNETEKSIAVKNLSALKEKGIIILLDDFGKGFTNFSDLKDFDISIVKIDKSITQNATSETGFLILKNIIKTAHDLGFKTLCEGVETEEHRKAVVNAGCDILQGYLLYRPMPVTQFESLLNK